MNLVGLGEVDSVRIEMGCVGLHVFGAAGLRGEMGVAGFGYTGGEEAAVWLSGRDQSRQMECVAGVL